MSSIPMIECSYDKYGFDLNVLIPSTPRRTNTHMLAHISFKSRGCLCALDVPGSEDCGVLPEDPSFNEQIASSRK